MDGVEIVIAVEDAFGIRLTDSEAEKVNTPRELIDLVVGKVNLVTAGVCLSHRAFNLSRRSILHFSDVPRKSVRLSTRLADVIPRQKRSEFVRRVLRDLGSTEEKFLKRPKWLSILLFAISVVAGFATTIAISPGTVFGLFSILVGTCAAVVFLGVKLTEGFRTEFPQDLQTVGEFSRWLKGRSPKLADDQREGWTREQIAVRVREIVIEILGCEREYREDARFIEDLKMD